MKGQALLALAVLPLIVLQAPSVPVNWTYTNSNPLGTNYVQQTQLTGSNVNNLTLSWAFSFPAASPPGGLNLTGQGAIAPPLVVDGIVYVAMNDLHLLALRASDGAVLWTYQPTLNRTGLPLGTLAGHVHGLTYHDGEVWLSLPDCSALAVNALTGSPAHRINRICADIPGNGGQYDYSGTPIVFDGDVMFWTATSVSEGTDAGRGFVAAYNITSGALLWRWFVSPPAGGDPGWDSDSCPPPCHGNVPNYPGDWGTLGQAGGRSRAGAGPGWGEPAVDARDGLLFVGTSQASPDWNATYRPGPNLYSDSIIALNVSDGRMVWFYQTTPHDLYDFDCGWNVALGSSVVNGANVTTVFKACKNGYVYALGAKSGDLVWVFDPPSLRRLNTANADYTVSGKYNATEPWTPTIGGSVVQCPGVNGGIESDISVAYGKVFVATHNFCSIITQGGVEKVGGGVSGASSVAFDYQHANSTIYAVDASTGREVWSYFIPGIAYRGWLTSTGEMVLASTLSGRLLALDVGDGHLVGSTALGTSLYEGVTIGTDTAGRVTVFQLTSSPAYGGFSAGVPGSLLALVPAPVQPAWEALLPWALAALVTAIAAVVVLRTRAVRNSPETGVSPTRGAAR